LAPSRWLVVSSAADLLVAAALATCGIAMKSLPIPTITGVLVAAAAFAILVDFAKIPALRSLGIR
jgi:H+-transporting ATPase